MITKGQRVKVICSEARLKEVGVRQKHIKHILGKIGTVKEIRKLPNTDDMYAYFVHFRYVNLKAAPGNKKPYYAMLDDMIEPINLEVVGEGIAELTLEQTHGCLFIFKRACFDDRTAENLDQSTPHSIDNYTYNNSGKRIR